jgi:hypothetical protein
MIETFFYQDTSFMVFYTYSFNLIYPLGYKSIMGAVNTGKLTSWCKLVSLVCFRRWFSPLCAFVNCT